LEQLVGSPAAPTRLLELRLQLLQPGCLSRARRLQALELTTQLALALALDLTQLRLQLGNAPLAGVARRLARGLARTLRDALAAPPGPSEPRSLRSPSACSSCSVRPIRPPSARADAPACSARSSTRSLAARASYTRRAPAS